MTLIESDWGIGNIQIECHLPENSGIEHLLEVIAKSDDDAYFTKDNRLILNPALEYIPVVLKSVMNNKHRWRDIYSPSINLFLKTFDKFFNEEFRFDGPNERIRGLDKNDGAITVKRMGDWVNDFFRCLRKQLHSEAFKRTAKNWAGDYGRRMKALNNHINGCFDLCSRLLVVRVDLYQEKFKVKQIQDRHHDLSVVNDNELKVLMARIDRFQNNRRHNKLFKHLISHILKIEYGPDRGYHVHLMLFFNGHKVENDSYYSIAVGNYWVDRITEGEGSYWACNRAGNKTKYQYLGIGMIKKTDSAKRDCLLRAASYLAKSDLHLTTKACEGQKLLRIGQLPTKAPGAKRGPRVKEVPSSVS